ncbi:hypothetical protein A2U01_0078403, partial [Trifolium medium]|nr:hypothetical protein [Trifolium medium]
MAGRPSGPGAAVPFICWMACCTSSAVKTSPICLCMSSETLCLTTLVMS